MGVLKIQGWLYSIKLLQGCNFIHVLWCAKTGCLLALQATDCLVCTVVVYVPLLSKICQPTCIASVICAMISFPFYVKRIFCKRKRIFSRRYLLVGTYKDVYMYLQCTCISFLWPFELHFVCRMLLAVLLWCPRVLA